MIGWLASAAVVLAAAAAFLRWVLPRWRRLTAKVEQAFEAVNGREAIIDRATGLELAPPVPGIGVRMNDSEADRRQITTQLRVLTQAIIDLAKQERRLDDHEARIQNLEGWHEGFRAAGQADPNPEGGHTT